MQEVRLFEYSVEKDAVSVEAETGIIEIERADGRVGRYLRTDGFDSEGRRLYGLLGLANERSDGCPSCSDPWDLYLHRLGDELAHDHDRGGLLLQCRDCGSLLEAHPEERATPCRLSLDDARRTFPGAL